MRTIILPCVLYIGIVLTPVTANAEEIPFEIAITEEPSAEMAPEATGTPPAPQILAEKQDCSETCASNVLFLPGIKGSRLYAEGTEQVWEPFGNQDIEAIMLDEDGTSLREDIHTRPGKLVDYVALVQDIYGSFRIYMNHLVEDGTIQDWESYVYDWRLSLPTIVGHASEDGDVPDLEQTLRTLASTSKSGKVSIVAHSNGGLVAKELIRSLGDEEAAHLIDRMIFVGVPQSGAPQALAALLYGYKEGLPWWFPGIVSTGVARAFAENAPMSYHLLPSDAYFASANASGRPVASFAGMSGYAEERSAYGDTLDSYAELRSFALAEEGGREKPDTDRIDQANILNPTLLAYASDAHDVLDAWTPPLGIDLYQIAGWGEETVSGIEFYERCLFSLCKEMYRPTFTEDGDGVVPVSSAHAIPESDSVTNLWFDLLSYNDRSPFDKDHGNLMALSEMKTQIENILTENISTLEYVSTQLPDRDSQPNIVRYFLHSPLTLELTDENGRSTSADNEEIPNAMYGELGDMKYISAFKSTRHSIEMHGYDSGTFTFEIQESSHGEIISEKVFVNVPVTPTTVARIDINFDSSDSIALDSDGDGAADLLIEPQVIESTVLETPSAIDNESGRASRSQRRVTAPLTLDDLMLRLRSLLLELLDQLERDARTQRYSDG